MALSMVRRRVAGYAKVKAKARVRPRAPAPRRNGDDDEPLIGEPSRPAVPLAASGVRRMPEKTGWRKALPPAALALGLLACVAIAFLVLKDAVRFASGYSAAVRSAASPSSAGASPRRGGQSSEYPGGSMDAGEVVLSHRTAPTDESFLAAAYARRKAALPKTGASGSADAGECVVKGGGMADIDECLRRHGRR